MEPSNVEPSKECAWVCSCEHEQQTHYYWLSALIYWKQKRDIDQVAQIQQDWMGKSVEPSKVEPSKVEPSKECAWVHSCEHEQQTHYYWSSALIYREQKRDVDQVARIQQDWIGKSVEPFKVQPSKVEPSKEEPGSLLVNMNSRLTTIGRLHQFTRNRKET